jgi:hypothetical protein
VKTRTKAIQKALDRLPSAEALTEALGGSLEPWAQQCHAASLALVNSGVFGDTFVRVAAPQLLAALQDAQGRLRQISRLAQDAEHQDIYNLAYDGNARRPIAAAGAPLQLQAPTDAENEQ